MPIADRILEAVKGFMGEKRMAPDTLHLSQQYLDDWVAEDDRAPWRKRPARVWGMTLDIVESPGVLSVERRKPFGAE